MDLNRIWIPRKSLPPETIRMCCFHPETQLACELQTLPIADSDTVMVSSIATMEFANSSSQASMQVIVGICCLPQVVFAACVCVCVCVHPRQGSLLFERVSCSDGECCKIHEPFLRIPTARFCPVIKAPVTPVMMAPPASTHTNPWQPHLGQGDIAHPSVWLVD